MSRRVRVGTVLGGVLAAVLGTASSGAQTVRGTVKEDTGAPVGGAVVTLLAGDRRVASTLSGDDGRFSVRAPAPGSYALEVKRIGVRVVRAGPFELTADQTRQEDVTVRPIPRLQPEVRVAGRTKCVVRPDASEVTATVWANARAALDAVRLTEQQRLVHASITRFARDLDPQTYRVLKEERRESFTYGERPFVSAPAEELSRLGYVRREGNGFVYFAPDVSVILSDVFLGEHCFRLVKGTGADSTNVGLAFEPVSGRAVADVSGSLWVDKRTSELRSLVFVYEHPPPPHDRGQAGGSLHFRRIPTGAWIVDRWTIRWPRFAGNTRRDPASTAVVFGNRQPSEAIAYREEGGEATVVNAGDVGFGVLRGRVMDPDRGAPAPNAHVFVSRGSLLQARAESDAQGNFVADTLPPGTYNVAVTAPRLDSLGIAARSREVTVRAHDSLTVELALPIEQLVWQALCPNTSPNPDAAILRLLVTEGRNGEPRSGATVRVSWGGQNAGAATGTTDDDGARTFCEVPVGRKVRVSLTDGTREVAGRDVTLTPAGLVVLPLAAPVVR